MTSYLKYILVRCVQNTKSTIVEGQLRCEELAKYLTDMKAVKSIWISEDATAIVAKINYDPKTNQLVGILLPSKNGCPIPFRFVSKIFFT